MCLLALSALVGVPQALAHTSSAGAPAYTTPPPVITLLSPADGSSFYTTGKNNPTFRWQVTYNGPVTANPTIELQWSDDPAFHEVHSIDFVNCYSDKPACFTERQPQGSFWYTEADTCLYTPPGPNCPRPKGAPLVLYWRVGVRFWAEPVQSNPEVYSPVYKLYGKAKPDTDPPHVSVIAGTGRRGHRASFYFHISDDSHVVPAAAGLYYHSQTVFSASQRFTDAFSSKLYYMWFHIPSGVPVGEYKACVVARDPVGHRATDCAPFRVR